MVTMSKRRKYHGTKVKESLPERIFCVCNYILLTLIALLMLYPILNVLAVSFSNYNKYLKTPWMIWPRRFTTEAYKLVFRNRFFWLLFLLGLLFFWLFFFRNTFFSGCF